MGEKSEFDKRRLKQLLIQYSTGQQNSSHEISERLNAENKFRDCLLTPLDIPLIKDEKFVDWFFENRKKIEKLKPDVATPDAGYQNTFYSVDVINEKYDLDASVWSMNLVPEFNSLFPNLYDQFMEYFPFKSIEKYSFWCSDEAVGPHRDNQCFLDLPASFRVMIHDENPQSTLYVEEYAADSKTPVPNKFKYLPRMEDTNSYAWSNLRLKHGSNFNVGSSKIIVLFHHYTFDWNKYNNLLDRSIAKYPDHVLTSNLQPEDFYTPRQLLKKVD